MRKDEINQRIDARRERYMHGVIERARDEMFKSKLESVGQWVRNQTWYKANTTDRHYTKAHAYRRCTCTRPENWLFNVIDVK
jgi:hypothetical protein